MASCLKFVMTGCVLWQKICEKKAATQLGKKRLKDSFHGISQIQWPRGSACSDNAVI